MAREPTPQRVWIVPHNDLESVTILQVLRDAGERVIVTSQRWGATWEGIEGTVKSSIEALPRGAELIGVELAGANTYGARNIDHHRYQNDDRYRSDSSLEQVTAILGVGLTHYQALVAANDRGYIPEMLRIGATPKEVERIRQADRAAQGLTAEDEARAAAEVSRAVNYGDGRSVVACDRPTSAHLDLMFGKATEVLLTGSREWLYSGPCCADLQQMDIDEKHWSGGQPDAGYFGVADPGSSTRARVRDWFVNGARRRPYG